MSVLTDAVDRSADARRVSLTIDRIADVHPGVRERLEADEQLRAAVVAAAAASRALANRLATDAEALDVLAGLDTRPAGPPDDPVGLARWKGRELLRIAARDLLGLDGLEPVGSALAQLADDVLDAAWRMAGEPELAIIGMGKLGASELNYASDIDVMFVGAGDARPIMDTARTCFRVDANLRPEGRDGPLVRTVDSFIAYWGRWAEPWEFQALLKARAVAGEREIGRAFGAAAGQALWGRTFGADDIRSVRAMKARAEAQVHRRGLAGRELKLGPGGIRDIEFTVQLLQLVHGRHDPDLRVPATLDALHELAQAGYVDDDDAAALDRAYRLLRAVEHRLQLVDEQQVHSLPTDTVAREQLARVMGHPDLRAFDDQLRLTLAEVRTIHERVYFRPLLEAFAAGPGAMPVEAVEARLAAFGFTDVARTRQALAELTRGLTRSSRLMHQLLPLLLQWLADSPDPDLGLLGLRGLASGPHRTSRLVATFRESPEAARRLCLLLGTSRLLQRQLERAPEVTRSLADDRALAPRDRADLLARTAAALEWRAQEDDRRAALLRLKDVEELRIAARDLLGQAEVESTAVALSQLAEAILERSLSVLEPTVAMAIVAMGRFGGSELSYASDLDVLLVYDGNSAEHFAAAERTAERLLTSVKGSTPATRLYLLDLDLRPEGKQGPLARSLDGYRTYYDRWAQTWERQALLRARPVAGDPDVGAAFMAAIDPFVWGPLTDEQAREIRRMKARIERERIPPNDDPQFHLKLGRGALADVEWTVQLLQLVHGVRSPGTMTALQALKDAGAMAADDAAVLAEAYRFCERTRNRWYLVKGAAGDAMPTQADALSRLARSLDTTAGDLRDDYRRVTRRCRAVVERLFYDRST